MCWLQNNTRHILHSTDVMALRKDGWLGDTFINAYLYILAKLKHPEWAVEDLLVMDVLNVPPHMHGRGSQLDCSSGHKLLSLRDSLHDCPEGAGWPLYREWHLHPTYSLKSN